MLLYYFDPKTSVFSLWVFLSEPLSLPPPIFISGTKYQKPDPSSSELRIGSHLFLWCFHPTRFVEKNSSFFFDLQRGHRYFVPIPYLFPLDHLSLKTFHDQASPGPRVLAHKEERKEVFYLFFLYPFRFLKRVFFPSPPASTSRVFNSCGFQSSFTFPSCYVIIWTPPPNLAPPPPPSSF